MYILKQVPQTRVELVWDQELAGAALWRTRQLRGALARAFADDDLFHQHTADGKPLYRYPRIQYRWWQGRGIGVGWGEAVTRLLQ
jgi:hypothetical protein